MVLNQLGLAYDHFLAFVVEKATPEEILAFTLPDTIRERAIELLDKQDEGTLTLAEEEELHRMGEVDRLLLALKARALEAMQSK